MVTHLTSYKQWVLLLLTALFLQVIYASEGCGGTVSVAPELSKLSKEKVDFTKVTVKLVSRDGILKYSSECAPTGHFFVPTYDKGNFFLEIEGPNGWNFEPSRVPVSISEDSPCDHNINFKFTGFSLKGKVISAGSSNKVGPKGVTLTLFVEGTKATTAVSDETGAYSFDNVYPGHYEISASHPRWKISPERLKTHMEWNNLEVDTPFVVAGYAVSGSVVSEDKKAISGVDVFLVSESASSLSCSPSSIPASIKSKGKSFCVAKSGANGEFEFASVPVGDYSLMPHYSSEQTTFHLSPESSTLKVTNGDVIVDAPFTVVGFDVSGRVVAGESGIEGAKVLVNGAEKTVTAKDGSYKLEKFKTGVYDITAVKADYEFSVLKGIKVSSNQPKLSNIQSTEVSVCGTLSIANPPPNVKVGLRDVQITANNNNNFKQKTVRADKDGKYCVSLPAGSYTITPIVSSAEERSGLNFSPSQATVNVASTPLSDISFSQLRVTVSGRVTCIPSASSSSCDTGVSVSLVPTSSSSSASPATAGLGLDNQFTFRDVLPGTYRLSVDIPSDVWCWDEQVKTVTITKDSSDFEFVQTGFVLPVTSSHDTELIVNRVGGKKGEEEVHKVKAGENGKVCLKKTGNYNVVPKSCFKFGNQDSFSFDTAAPTPLNLQASHMLVKGSVAADNVPEVDVAVYDSQNNKVATLNAKAEKGSHAIHFEHWATPGSSLKFSPSTPLNSAFLPHPPSREFSVPSSSLSCLSPLAPFELKKGNFLEGKVIPGIAGVRISVKNPAGDELAHVMTSSDGSYSVGPLYDGEQHTVKAEKSDFHFQSDASGLVFRAAKLGRVRINAVDETTNEAVSGVLLSLSGEGYHNNTAIPTGTGALVFSDLFPGSYFVRAHLKEYTFTPAHASVNVKEGEEAIHTFKVKRIAFSCFGSVKGLNSFPERGVVVLAQPVNNPAAPVEETQTDSTGSFRLRGLQPTVTYSIFVKNSLSSSVSADNLRSSSSGDLAIPEAIQVTIAKQDTHNADFVVIRKPAYIDIVGTVNASAEHLSSLSVSLFDSRTSLDTPVKTIPLGISRAFIFTDIPAKSDSEYVVRLTTSLATRSYHISISPDVSVQPRQVAGPRSLPLSFSFDASLKKDETEVPVSGISSFVLLLVVPFLLFKYQERVLPIATRAYYLIRQYRTGVPAPKVAVRPKKATSSSQNEFDFLPAHLSKAKQKTKTK